MARSLARNTKVFASTLTLANFTIGNATPQNTFEIKVLDGYSFSQSVANQEIGVNESNSECAGAGLARGTLTFNTALNPVDVSFSTYVRPYPNTIDITGGANAYTDCVERVLWASAMGSPASWATVTSTGAAAGEVITAQGATSITFGLGTSNVNELLPLTLFFVLENATYVVEQFNVSTAEVDFSIDGIATINWTGNGSRVNEDPAVHELLKHPGGTFVADTNYQSVPATTTTTFLRNRLSSLTMVNNEDDIATAVTDAISGTPTGGVITLAGTVTASAFVGGRVRNTTLTPDEWATVLSNTTGSVTVVPADADKVDLWSDTNVLELYTEAQHAGVIYCIPITGATLTLENNITYLTPEELAIVNLPLAGYAGNRVTSGSLTAYLNTGAQGSGGLLDDLLAKIEDSVTTDYALTFHMGNTSSSTPRVDFIMPHATVGIPSTNVQDIISTEITFTAKPWSAAQGAGSFEDTNELTITYYDL